MDIVRKGWVIELATLKKKSFFYFFSFHVVNGRKKKERSYYKIIEFDGPFKKLGR